MIVAVFVSLEGSVAKRGYFSIRLDEIRLQNLVLSAVTLTGDPDSFSKFSPVLISSEKPPLTDISNSARLTQLRFYLESTSI